ncbi:unnamed protein product [Lupinus luteus]|uniref:histidine kinase n=1 Tax=Lupinus luteus TaxID=3873 RepID=A0AAV1XHQ3_LUPLU
MVTDTDSNEHVQFYLATKDGKVLVQGVKNIRLVVSNDSVSFQSLNPNGNLISNVGSVSCKDEAIASRLNIWDTEYLIQCHPIDIMGKKSVYVLAVSQNVSLNFDLNRYNKKGLQLLIAMIAMILIAMFSFLFINVRATRREMQLCASLIKQMEATQQAERKNMNKSLAFASASHDVRTSLAGLTGLLNSILDTSKIEAGKMHLDEEEFDLSYLLEDVVDLYHPVAMKKGVDIVLDPCNGSLMKYSSVKGDRGKLKQVRLMHGDIGIVDKDIGEKGTCFRFNVLLTLCEAVTNVSTKEGSEHGSGDRNNAQGLIVRTKSSGSSICNPLSPRLHICNSTRRPQASHVVLLIVDKERRRISQRFMESLGIEVKVVRHWKHLFDTLKHINQKGNYSSNQSSPVSSELSFRSISHSSFSRIKGVPLSTMDGTESMPPVLKKNDTVGAAPGFILIVIDANAGPFSELCRVVSIFRKGLYNPCKVVWLNKPLFHGNNLKITLNKDLLDPNDILISKPFHGTRLFQVIKLLPEYAGACQSSFRRSKKENAVEQIGGKIIRAASLSKLKSPLMERSQSESSTDRSSFQSTVKATKYIVPQGETQECGHSSNNESLSGKRFLVVEDNALLRKVALATLIPLGATIEQCENGEQAVQLVEEGFATRDLPYPPYDYILMDCEMPVMDGFEATKQIREMERPYGFHIPIIALTAHTDNVATEDGMDFHLVKPIKRQHVLEAIRYIHARD